MNTLNASNLLLENRLLTEEEQRKLRKAQCLYASGNGTEWLAMADAARGMLKALGTVRNVIRDAWIEEGSPHGDIVKHCICTREFKIPYLPKVS